MFLSSGIIMKIHLTRHLGYHMVQTYIPSMVFVTLSWMALFVSAENIPGNNIISLGAIHNQVKR